MMILFLAVALSAQTPPGCQATAVHCVVVAHQTTTQAEVPYKYVANQSLFRAQYECWRGSSAGWVSWNNSPTVVESWNCPLLKQQLEDAKKKGK